MMKIANLNKTLGQDGEIKETHLAKRQAKCWIMGAVLVLLILIISVVSLIIYQEARATMRNAKLLSSAVKEQNFDQINTSLSKTHQEVKKLDNILNFFVFLKVIPWLGSYYSDTKHLAKALDLEMAAGEKILAILEPAKEELGLAGTATAGQDKVAQGLKILNKVLPFIDQIAPFSQQAKEEMENINIDKYPEKYQSFKLRKTLAELKDAIKGLDLLISDNRGLLTLAPDILGSETPKTYLILFQNDKELRPTGGFLTAYAFLKVDKGHISATSSDDIYRLDERLLKVCLFKICPLSPPEPIVKYLPELSGKPRSAWSMRDANISPDLPTSMKEFERMYQMLGDGLNFDGIITIDTKVVEELIKLTGPVDILGTTYSADFDKRCNCANVIYELEHYAEVAAKGEPDRKAVLGSLMQQMMLKILGMGLSQMPDFIKAAVSLANEKHIMFYNHDPKIEEALAKLNWTGQIVTEEGDYLHINDANFAGGKANLYVEENVTMNINIDSLGHVNNKVIIEYNNPNLYSAWLNGILRDYLRVYVPWGSILSSGKGSDDPIQSKEDIILQKNFFEGFLTVRPQNSRTLSFEYNIPYQPSSGKYSLLIQKQPGSKDHHYLIKVNGQTKAEFDLTADKKLDLTF